MEVTSTHAPAHADFEKLRRHIRILVDLGRLAGETAELDRFLHQAVVQVARAVEIDHVKVLRYRRTTSESWLALVGRKVSSARLLYLPTCGPRQVMLPRRFASDIIEADILLSFEDALRPLEEPQRDH